MVDLIEPKTGQVYRGLAKLKGKKFPKGTQFLSIFEEGWQYLSSTKLKPTECMVLFKFLEHIEFENWIRTSQQLIAEELEIHSPNVSYAVKNLIKLEIIEQLQDPYDHRRRIYRFNPALGWKGNAEKWFECMLERPFKPNSKIKPPAIFGQLLKKSTHAESA